MSSVSVVKNQPQTAPVQATDDKSTAPVQAKQEENNQPAGAKPTSDPAAQKNEHAMEGQARAAALDAKLTQADQAKIDENAKYINEKLSYGVTDLAVTDQEVKDVRSKLDSLSPGEYKGQIERMSKDGVLQRYMDNMSDTEKKAFLEQGAKKGYLNGGQVKVPDGPMNPPSGPVLYDNKPGLPKEMREVISDQNLERAGEYDKAYGQYMERYTEALDKCKNAEEMRALGHWAPKHPLGQEPGYSNKAGDALADKWADERITKTRGDKEARELAMEKMFTFTGRRPAGDVFVEVEANAKAEYVNPVGTSMGGGVKGGFTAGTGSGFQPTYGAEGGGGQQFGKDGPKVSVTHETDGSTTYAGEMKGHGVSYKTDGTVEVKVKVAGNDKAGIGPYGSYNPKQAEMKQGVQGSIGTEGEVPGFGGEVKVEAGGKVGVGVRGITADEAYESLRQGPGYWNDPAELQQGKSWKELPKETKERYEKHYGWSEQEWQGKLPKYQPDAA